MYIYARFFSLTGSNLFLFSWRPLRLNINYYQWNYVITHKRR